MSENSIPQPLVVCAAASKTSQLLLPSGSLARMAPTMSHLPYHCETGQATAVVSLACNISEEGAHWSPDRASLSCLLLWDCASCPPTVAMYEDAPATTSTFWLGRRTRWLHGRNADSTQQTTASRKLSTLAPDPLTNRPASPQRLGAWELGLRRAKIGKRSDLRLISARCAVTKTMGRCQAVEGSSQHTSVESCVLSGWP